MADEPENKRLVRFFLPRGLDVEVMAKAIQEIRREAMQEAAEEKKATERGGGQSDSEPPGGLDLEQAEGRLQGEPGAET
jgi:hypothetical protein